MSYENIRKLSRHPLGYHHTVCVWTEMEFSYISRYKVLWALKMLNLGWNELANMRPEQKNEMVDFWLRAYERYDLYKKKDEIVSWPADHEARIQSWRLGIIFNSRLQLFLVKLRSKKCFVHSKWNDCFNLELWNWRIKKVRISKWMSSGWSNTLER